jgi:hypothetical protein
VKDMIAYEQQIIPELLKTSVERAEQLISLQQHYGTHFREPISILILLRD